MVQKVKEVRTDKDARKERMSADTKTTYGAPPKKNGQGGAYTWTGNDLTMTGDLTPTDASAVVSNLNVVPEVESSNDETTGFRMVSKEFPPLGNTSSGSVPTSPARKAQEDSWSNNVLMDKDFKL